jgi:hypothetical protein
MAVAVCPHCGQPIASERLGVRLTPLKARIIDVIKAAGEVGVSSAELVYDVYGDRARVPLTSAIKSHVWQINEVLEQTGWVIQSDRRRWFLRRRRQGRRAA